MSTIDDAADAAWIARAKEYVAFVDAFGRAPRRNSQSAQERRLGEWLRGWSTCYWSSKQAGREAWMDQHAESWRVQPSRMRTNGALSEQWLGNAAQYVEFVRVHGRPPSTLGEPREARLEHWRLRWLRKYPAYRANREAWFDENLPGWRARKLDPFGDKWLATANEYVQFVRERGRKPSRNGQPQEVRLYQWMGGWSGATSSIERREAREAWFDEQLSEWRLPNRELSGPLTPPKRRPGGKLNGPLTTEWLKRAEELVAFVQENKRLPQRRADAYPAERSLREWMYDSYRRGKPELREVREAWFDERLPAWRELTSGVLTSQPGDSNR